MPLIRIAPTLAFFTLLSSALLASAADRDVQVLRYETVALDFKATQIAAAGKYNSGSALRFTAFGKTYTANLEINDRVSVAVASRAQAYRGAIDGQENSWVRITRIGDEVHGLFFDGADLIAIEPASAIDGSATGTAIFRLADTKTDLGANFCSSATAPILSGLDMYRGLGADSKSIQMQTQTSAHLRLDISAVMDAAFRNRYATDAAANDAIIARMNNVDGIFNSQVGVDVAVAQIVAPESSSQQIFTSTSPDTLLQSVSRFRSTSASIYNIGNTHLFTGADLDGSTVGIAYINSVCDRQYGVSLSEARDRGVWFDSLVAAHELGHSFGSPHDGEGQCATTPNTFLMAPVINGNDQFSQCSLGIITARVQTASCLVQVPLADISVTADSGSYHAAQSQTTTFSITASNTGSADALSSQLRLNIPAGLTISSAIVDGGTCSSDSGAALICNLGTLTAHTTRAVQLTASSAQIGVYSISGSVSAYNDSDTTNNATSAIVRVVPSMDLAVAMSAPDSVTPDQSFNASVSISNKSGQAASNVTLSFVVPSGVAIGTAQLEGATCQTQFQTVQCLIASLAASRTINGTLSLSGHDAGSVVMTATLDGAYVDPTPQDNIAQKTIVIGAASAPSTSNAAQPQEKSGGGATSFYFLLALSLFARHKLRNRSVGI